MTKAEKVVQEHLEASKRFRKSLRSQAAARKFLIEAGILNKKGTQLARRYRT